MEDEREVRQWLMREQRIIDELSLLGVYDEGEIRYECEVCNNLFVCKTLH